MKKTNISNAYASASSSFSSSLLFPSGETSDITKQTMVVYPEIKTRKQTLNHWKDPNKSFLSSNDIFKVENTNVQTRENSNEWIPETWKKKNGKIILPPLHHDHTCLLGHQCHHYWYRCMQINPQTILASVSTNIDNCNISNGNFPHYHDNQQQQHTSGPLYLEVSPFLFTGYTTIATIAGLSSPSSHNTYPCRNFEVIDQTLPPPTVLTSSLPEKSITLSLVPNNQQKKQQTNNHNTTTTNINNDNDNGKGIMMLDNTNNITTPTTVMTEPQQDQQRSIAKTTRRCFDYSTVYRLHVLLFESFGLDSLSKNVKRQKVIEETGITRSQVNNWISRHHRQLKGPIKLYRQLVQEKAIEHSYKSFISYCRAHNVMNELPSDDDEGDNIDSSSNKNIQNNRTSNDMEIDD